MNCAVPHCGARLTPTNIITVCRDHMHTKPHYKCRQCKGERPRYVVADPRDWRTKPETVTQWPSPKKGEE